MNVEVRNTSTDPSHPPGGTSRKIGLSCAECRRSKLKCDRIFPCQSCVRRGCAGICPDGTLAATKGNKVLMAHAQRLQEQVKTLTARIQDLEIELHHARGGKEGSPQPLLRPAILHSPDADHEEPVGSVSEGIGSLSIGLDGQAKYHGESASSEYFQDLLPSSDDFSSSSNSQPSDLPPDIIDLLNAFPFGFRDSPYVKDVFLQFVPDRERAVHLSNLYYANIDWMYEPVTRQDFTTTILELIYGPSGEKRVDTLHSHRLSVFFILLANGSVFDNDLRAIETARTYHALARAAFSMDSILVEATCATVQALFLIVRYLYNADRDRNEERWLITGLNCRLAHMIGLQRDSANWNLPTEEVQRRRRIFWELFTWDAWTGVVNGRPAALAVQHTDCQFPDDLEPSVLPGKEHDLGWHAWKFRYAANVLTASSYHVFSPRTPPYEALLDLDKKIRAFPLPAHLRSPVKNSDAGRSWSPDPSRAMQQYCAVCLRESNLLYIHRSYFAQALRQLPDNPLHHKYAASVMATYRAAIRLVASLRSLYSVHSRLTGFVWYFWSGVFSSCIVLGALVVESPKCTLANDALKELQSAIAFYEEGSRICRAQSTVPILEKLLQRAIAAYQTGSEVQQTTSEFDELHVLGGRKSVIKPTSNAGSPPYTGPGTPSSTLPDSEDGSSPSSQAGAVEMLAEYLGQPPQTYEVHKYEYDMDACSGTPTAYTEEALYAGKPAMMSVNPPQAYMRPFLSPPGSMMAPEPGFNYHRSQPMQMAAGPSSEVQHQQHQQQAWQTPYASPHHSHSHSHSHSNHHHPQQEHQPQQSHPSTPMLYGHPLDVHPPQAYHPIIQRYGPGAPPERTQEEIWRDFMMGYQQPN